MKKDKNSKATQQVKQVTEHSEKQAALESALTQIEKAYGKGSVMKLGDGNIHMNVETIPTGSLGLDIALGVGGIPKGRIIDAEHALDPAYAERIGVNINELYVSQPDNGEQALEITETMVRSGAIDIIIVDSVAALVPKGEIEGDMGDSHMGLQARLMSQGLRKLTGIVSKSNCIVIFINQLRDKIGVMFGSPETTTGGRALKFYASVRLDVRKVEQIKQGGELIGTKTRIKVVKNKVAPPFKEAEFDIMYGLGISKAGEILDLGVASDVIEKGGAWYSYEGNKIGQGRENAKKFLLDNPDICEKVEAQIREKFKLASENGEKLIEYDPIDGEEDEEFDGSPIEEENTNGVVLEEED